MFTFFTEVIKRDVLDRHGRWVGHPYDFTACLGETYPRLSSLVIKRGLFGRSYYVIPWKDVHQLADGFHLRLPIESLEVRKIYHTSDEPTLRTSILDQQVVDTFNRKVVRVNDIHFLCVDDDLRVAHVDIGLRGLVRRLGWERVIDGFVRFFHRHARYLTDEAFISWKYVQPLSIQSATGKVQLTVEMAQLKAIPPPDISTMLMDLDPYQRAALLKTLDVATQIDIITELDLKWQKDLIEALDTNTAVALFERMPADEATDLLSALPRRETEHILGLLSLIKARELTHLMAHESDSAGGLMTTEFITLKENMTVAEAIEIIRSAAVQKKAETIHNAYVIDDERKLIGSVSFRKILLERPDAKICDLMQRKPAVAKVSDSVEGVARKMDKYNLFAIPAVGKKGKLEGIITVDDVLHVAVAEAWGREIGSY